MIKTRILPVIAMTALMSGCMAPPPPAPPIEPIAPPPPVPVQGIQGLQERTPNMCGAKDYASSVGQPASVIPTLGITKEFRVIEYRGIVPQDYNPMRIVFRLDPANNIQRVDCG